MAVKIRLFRVGKKKQAYYRVVAKEQRSPRQGKYLENLGFYNPMANPEEVKLDAERVRHWLQNGAIPTDTAARLILKHTDIELPAKLVPRQRSKKKEGEKKES